MSIKAFANQLSNLLQAKQEEHLSENARWSFLFYFNLFFFFNNHDYSALVLFQCRYKPHAHSTKHISVKESTDLQMEYATHILSVYLELRELGKQGLLNFDVGSLRSFSKQWQGIQSYTKISRQNGQQNEILQQQMRERQSSPSSVEVLTKETLLYIPRDSRWTAERRWQCPHCQRSQQQSVKYSQEQWRWSRLPAALHPGSTTRGSARRWRWQSDRWILVLKRRTHPGCGLWCAGDSKHSGSGRQWPSILDTPKGNKGGVGGTETEGRCENFRFLTRRSEQTNCSAKLKSRGKNIFSCFENVTVKTMKQWQ